MRMQAVRHRVAGLGRRRLSLRVAEAVISLQRATTLLAFVRSGGAELDRVALPLGWLRSFGGARAAASTRRVADCRLVERRGVSWLRVPRLMLLLQCSEARLGALRTPASTGMFCWALAKRTLCPTVACSERECAADRRDDPLLLPHERN